MANPVKPIFYIILGAAGGALAGRIVRPYAQQFVGGKEENPTEERTSEAINEQPGDVTLMMDVRGAILGGGVAFALRPFLGGFPKLLLLVAFLVALISNASRGTKYEEEVNKTVGKVAPSSVESFIT